MLRVEPDWDRLADDIITGFFEPFSQDGPTLKLKMTAALKDSWDRQLSAADGNIQADHEVVLQLVPSKEHQSYGQLMNLTMAMTIARQCLPHLERTEQKNVGDAIRVFLDNNLTRMWDDIVGFHHKFGLVYKGPPRELPSDMDEFRTLFLAEELAEYAGVDPKTLCTFLKRLMDEAPKPVDTIQRRADKFDALLDLVYVALGTAYLRGVNWAEGWRRVQRANISKKRVERIGDSKRGSKYDVVKPEGWLPPDHTDLVGEVEEAKVQHDLF